MARGRSADPLGKLVPVTFSLPEAVVERLREVSAGEGVSASQFLRDLATIRLLGRSHALRMHADRLDRIAGNTVGIAGETQGIRWEDDLGE